MTNKATNSVYKKIETVLWDKKIPEKKPCCTYNKPFSSKLLTLQGNGTHSDASFVMLYHIPDLEPNRRQKICPVAKGLIRAFCTSFSTFIAHPSFYIARIEPFVGFCSFFFVFLLYLSQCAYALLFFKFNPHSISHMCICSSFLFDVSLTFCVKIARPICFSLT